MLPIRYVAYTFDGTERACYVHLTAQAPSHEGPGGPALPVHEGSADLPSAPGLVPQAGPTRFSFERFIMTCASAIHIGTLRRLTLQHPGARPDVAVAIDEPELDVEAVQPLVVVYRSPVKEAANVDAAGV